MGARPSGPAPFSLAADWWLGIAGLVDSRQAHRPRDLPRCGLGQPFIVFLGHRALAVFELRRPPGLHRVDRLGLGAPVRAHGIHDRAHEWDGAFQPLHLARGDVAGAGGVSPKGADAEFRVAESRYAVGWYQSITSDIWG